MKKIVLPGVLTLLCLVVQAQPQRGLKGEYDVTEFPKVTFVWNSPNPEPIDATRFSLTENENLLEFIVHEISVDNSKAIKKSILVLWEDMASHNRQSEFSRTLLSRFFSEVPLCAEDCFNVAVFNRKHDCQQHVLTPLLDNFTTDGEVLADAIGEYERSSEFFSTFPMQSDLYMAVNEGIGILKKEPADRMGIIIVVTAGLNVKAAGASTEMETVRQNAIRAGIPIYVVKYPVSGNTPEVNILAESTFGLVSSGIDLEDALNNLKEFYNQFNRRLHGRDYKFTFTTETERDGKVHPIKLKVDKVNRPMPPYKAPGQTFGMWAKSHILLVIFLFVALIVFVFLTIFLAKKNKGERQKHEEELRMQMEQQQKESELRNRETIDNLRREQQTKELAIQREREEHARVEEEERLTKLMQTKNLYPRLQCQMGNESFIYSIVKPHVTLGRNDDNDVVFNSRNDHFDNMTISGYHAEIFFDGTVFEVVNVSRSYTQGIVVNGQLCQRSALRSGDMIGLGEALLTFYL